MITRALVCIATFLAPTLLSVAAHAGNGGVLYNVDATYIPYWTQAQSPGVTWTFSTSNLSTGSDTVLHVQNWDDPQGGFIAGDDDGGGGHASLVVVPPAATARALVIIVRAYAAYAQGTCTVTATPSSGTPYSFTTSFGGVPQYVGDLGAASHVTMAEIQGGSGDTVLLAVQSGDPKHAVGFDDDDGVDRMSWIHLNEACPSCALIVGTYANVGTLKTNLVWDEDADTTDYDSDGLGASLESVICEGSTCLNSSVADTDQDGLSDGAELLGVDLSPPVKFPYMGADPLQKDLFWEMDWKKCNNSLLCPNSFDSGQMGAGIVSDADFQTLRIEPIKALLAGTGIRVHFDMGRANTNPATWSEWGAWGEATRLDTGGEDACGANNGSSPERAYLFHYGLGWSPDNPVGGFNCGSPGPSFNIMASDYVGIIHETGHLLGLQHGGRPFAGSINGKPQYRSLMNYFYEYDGTTAFSHGDFPTQGSVLNATAAKENPGLGPSAGTSLLTKLRDGMCPVTAYSSGKCVNINGNAGSGIPIGAIDWNRDGVYEAVGVTVRGPILEGDSEIARTAFDPPTDSPPWNGTGIIADPTLAWVSVGGAVGDQLWVFARDASNQLVWARTPRATLDAGCDSHFTSFYESGTFNCAQFGNPTGFAGVTTPVPGPIVLSSTPEVAPGAAEYGSGSNKQILLVFQRSTPGETIKAKLVTINSTNGNVTFGTDMNLTGGKVATGDITVVAVSATEVRVYAPVGSGAGARLHEWRYNGTWSDSGNGLGDQQWTDGTNIVPTFGIGATRGFQDGSATASTYAAIPVSPNSLVEFARKDNATPFRWSRVTFTCPSGSFGCANGVASSWAGTGGSCPASSTDRPCAAANPPGTQPMASARPGLAYQRKAGAANNVGRFYMAITQGTMCAAPFGTPQTWTVATCSSLLITTEGNLTTAMPPSKRLTWITPANLLSEPNFPVLRGVSLVDDLTRDTNLRAAFAFVDWNNASNVRGEFEPLADGIINVDLKDLDDYVYLTGGMRASLCLEGGVWPGTPPNPCVLSSLP